MKIVRSIFTILFSFILCLLLIALPYMNAINNCVISSKSLSNSIIESGVSKDIKNLIDDNIDSSIALVEENIKKETGNDLNDKEIAEVKEQVTDTLKSFNSEENINKLIETFIDISLDQQDFNLNSIIKNNINNVIKENNLNISQETQNEINNFVDEVTTDLNKEITTTFDGIITVNSNNAIVNPIYKYTSILKLIKTGMIIAISILIICIILMNFKNLRSASYSLMTCFIISGVTTLIGTLIISMFKNMIFNTSTDSISSLVENILNNVVNKANTLSVIYLIIAVLIIIGLVIAKQISKRKTNPELVTK